MSDKAASTNDRVVDTQGQKGLNVVSAGIDPRREEFNVSHREMLKSHLGSMTGQQFNEDMVSRVEDRLSKNGVKMEDISQDPENSKAAIAHALEQAKAGLKEEEGV
jgi:hypothetical protein